VTVRIAIVTPAVNRRGGTEKSLLFLVEQMAPLCDLTLYTGELADTHARGCTVRHVPVIGRPRLLRYSTFLLSAAAAFLIDRVRGRRYDVVLATSGDSPFSDVMYAHFCCQAWLDRIEDRTVHLPATRLAQRLRNAHYLAFLKVAAACESMLYRRRRLKSVIAVSSGTGREVVAAYGVDPKLISVVPNAVDERVRANDSVRSRQRAQVRARHGIEPQTPVVLFVAAGDWKRKGLLVALEGMALLKSCDARFMIVGHEDIEFYKSEVRRLGIAEKVVFCGFRADVDAYYAAADIFLYPSAYEAMALVGIEAAAAGLAVLTTKINGSEDFIRDGENGLFVQPDPADIAAKLQVVLGDGALRARLAHQARGESAGFTPELVAKRIFDICAGATTNR
jgi:UDP-glucose:(heptosyl)LPS alpha-1,3-glucosyltransferase